MRFCKGWCVLAILCLLLGLGCGIKAPPVAPETVVPAPVDDLQVTVTEGGIRLEWTLPERSLDGSDLKEVAGFKIIRSGPEGECIRREKWFPISERSRMVGKRLSWTDLAPLQQGLYTFWVVPFDTYGTRPPRGKGKQLIWDHQVIERLR